MIFVYCELKKLTENRKEKRESDFRNAFSSSVVLNLQNYLVAWKNVPFLFECVCVFVSFYRTCWTTMMIDENVLVGRKLSCCEEGAEKKCDGVAYSSNMGRICISEQVPTLHSMSAYPICLYPSRSIQRFFFTFSWTYRGYFWWLVTHRQKSLLFLPSSLYQLAYWYFRLKFFPMFLFSLLFFSKRRLIQWKLDLFRKEFIFFMYNFHSPFPKPTCQIDWMIKNENIFQLTPF